MIDPKIAEETKRFVEARDSYRADNPQVIGAFLDMKKEAFKPGGLDVATKYLMAVLMGVARGSERCILTHVPTAVDAGVSRQQLMEALNVSIVFGGAPQYGYATYALDVYDSYVAREGTANHDSQL